MSEVQTLARGLQILELLAEEEGGLTTTELTEKLEIDKSGISRLMNTLVKYRFVERDSQTRRYYLGTYIEELGKRSGQHTLLKDLSEPYLQNLVALTGENAHVAVYSLPHALTIADVPSTEPLRVVSEVGRRVTLHCSAIGKCLLAFSEIPLPTDYPRFTSKTIVERQQLKLQLEQIRYQGYALDDEELTLGVRGIAAPIRNREGRTIGTMGLSGPAMRLTFEEIPKLATLLIQNAEEVSIKLGFQTNPKLEIG